MKKITIIALMLISFFACPTLSHADYIIHLKHGGQFMTPKYWTDDGQIQFFVRGGTMGIERDTVKAIEKSIIDDNHYQKSQPVQPIPQTSPAPDKTVKKGEPVDLKAYQEKMAKLKTELNKTLSRIKKATAKDDTYEKDQATEENRRISAEMWSLTDELKGKNDGKLPGDWWAGVGQEE
jgi:hypothetical protein